MKSLEIREGFDNLKSGKELGTLKLFACFGHLAFNGCFRLTKKWCKYSGYHGELRFPVIYLRSN